MSYAPVALFTYNRPDHLKHTIEALSLNCLADESHLIVFSDGPKNPSDVKIIKRIREYLQSVSGFKSISIVEKKENSGLARSIVTGVTLVLKEYDKVIVVEDDLITSRHFLTFMNDALRVYESEERVISACGYTYPVKPPLPETFFIRGADCWGWATWRRGWALFEADGCKLLSELRSRRLQKDFNLHGAYNYTQMLKGQINGKNDSWAVRWHASAFLCGKYTLYPGRSLVYNAGCDLSGTHCASTAVYDTAVTDQPVYVDKIPIDQDERVLTGIEEFLRSTKPHPLVRLLNRVRTTCRKRR